MLEVLESAAVVISSGILSAIISVLVAGHLNRPRISLHILAINTVLGTAHAARPVLTPEASTGLYKRLCDSIWTTTGLEDAIEDLTGQVLLDERAELVKIIAQAEQTSDLVEGWRSFLDSRKHDPKEQLEFLQHLLGNDLFYRAIRTALVRGDLELPSISDPDHWPQIAHYEAAIQLGHPGFNVHLGSAIHRIEHPIDAPNQPSLLEPLAIALSRFYTPALIQMVEHCATVCAGIKTDEKTLLEDIETLLAPLLHVRCEVEALNTGRSGAVPAKEGTLFIRRANRASNQSISMALIPDVDAETAPDQPTPDAGSVGRSATLLEFASLIMTYESEETVEKLGLNWLKQDSEGASTGTDSWSAMLAGRFSGVRAVIMTPQWSPAEGKSTLDAIRWKKRLARYMWAREMWRRWTA